MASSGPASLDETQTEPMALDNEPTEVTLIAPQGTRFQVSKDIFQYSPALGLLEMYGESTEFNLQEKLTIHGGNPGADLSEGRDPHTLFGVPDKFYEIVIKHLTQLHADEGKWTTPSDRSTMFAAEYVAPKAYWPLVKDLTIEEIGVLDKVAIFFGIDSLKELNELAMAYWVKGVSGETEDVARQRIAEKAHILRPIIERDLKIEEAKRARQQREEATAAASGSASGAASGSASGAASCADPVGSSPSDKA